MTELFDSLVRLTARHAHSAPDLVPPPALTDSPCWHAAERMTAEGVPIPPAIREAAFWEWIAAASLALYGDDAADFARHCRAVADVAVAA